MKLVPADSISEEDRALQHLLDVHPVFKWHLALLLNGYRELCQMCMESMDRGETDTVDIVRSLYKKDNAARRYSLPLFETPQDWEEARKQLREVRG